MQIRITLGKEYFESLLVDLLSKALKRQLTEDQVKSIVFDYAGERPSKLTAVIELTNEDGSPLDL